MKVKLVWVRVLDIVAGRLRRHAVTIATILLGLQALSTPARCQTNIISNPSGNQSITQPSGTTLNVNQETVGNLTATTASLGNGSSGTGLILQDSHQNSYGLSMQNGWLSVMQNMGSGIAFDPTSNGGNIIFIAAGGSTLQVVDADTGNSPVLGVGPVAQPIFCASSAHDFVGVGTPNACNAYDIFDVSNREAFGNGYMHWYAQGFVPPGQPDGAMPGWDAGISNPSTGVLSFDAASDGDGLGTVKVGQVAFPDGSTLSSANIYASQTYSNLTVSSATSPSLTVGTTAAAGAGGVSNILLQSSAHNWQLSTWNSGNAGIYPGSLGVVDNTAGVVRQLFDPSGDIYIGMKTGDGTVTGSSLSVLANGYIGIGTTTPGAQLDVNGNVKISGAGASITFPDGTIQATAFTGNVCRGGDYAESVDVDGAKAEYAPGDIMVLDPDHPGNFQKSSSPYSPLVAGIYSTKPGFIGRRQTTDPKTANEIPLAMVGIVPTKVSTEGGPIHAGDLLVTSSTPGMAMRADSSRSLTGQIVGKALANLGSGFGVIEVLVSLQ